MAIELETPTYRHQAKPIESAFRLSIQWQPDEFMAATIAPIARSIKQEQLLTVLAKTVCKKYKIDFAQLSSIQKMFITHYKCSECGLLPLYYIDIRHIKRARCRKCGQLTSLRSKGKFGKMRKAIALEIREHED